LNASQWRGLFEYLKGFDGLKLTLLSDKPG
jgi:hypothetical protein